MYLVFHLMLTDRLRKFFFTLVSCLALVQTGRSQTPDGDLVYKINLAKTDSERAQAYRDFVFTYVTQKPELALSTAAAALKYFTTVDYKPGIAMATALQAQVYYMQGKTDLARSYFIDASEIYKEIGNNKRYANMVILLGIVESEKGNRQSAIKKFNSALTILDAIHDTIGLIDCYIKLGVVNESLDSLNAALVYYHKALVLIGSDTVNVQAVTLFNNIGIVYGKTGDYVQALSYFNRGIAKCDQIKDSTDKINLLLDLGMLGEESGEPQMAIQYLQQALDESRKNHSAAYEARVLKGLGVHYLNLSDPRAQSYLEQALSVAQSLGQDPLIADICDDLVQALKKKGDFQTALKYAQLGQSIKEKISRQDKANELANLQALNDLEKSKAKIKRLTYLVQKNKVKRNIILGITFCNFLILVVLAFSYRKSIQLNRQLTKRKEELTEANEVKDKLFSIIGHDLRGPIGNIPALLDFYVEPGTDEAEKTYFIDNIRELATGCKDTLDKLLYWGKANIGGTRLNMQVINVKEHVENCLRLVRSAAAQKNIVLEDRTSGDLQVFADPEHLEFVVRNLLANAVKFTFNGGRIEIGTLPQEGSGMTKFYVRDTGKGIAPEKVPTIFEALGKSTVGTAQEKGTNIGLKLCHDFIQENGGKIWVESQVGVGTTFFFTLRNSSTA